VLLHYNINIVVLKNKMEKEKTPVERLHDDIRQAIQKIEDDVDDEMIRIHITENDDAG
tara:strand:+ start:94 stop:267 length:174 start_codon:yes stop_codon:yes gene_type:complete